MTSHPGNEPKGIKEQIASFGRALTVAEVSDLFGISEGMLYKQVRSGVIPCFRIGTSVRFDPQRLAEWIEEQQIGF